MQRDLQARATAAFSTWKASSGHYIRGSYVPFVAGYERGYEAARSSTNVLESNSEPHNEEARPLRQQETGRVTQEGYSR